MKLPYQVLNDLTDAQTNFEQLQTSVGKLQTTTLTFPTVAQPTRIEGTIYQPSTTRPTMITIEFNFVCAAAQTESHQVLIGASSPPATLIHEPELSVAAGGATIQAITALTFPLPAGWFYKLASVTHTGTNAYRFTEFTF